MLFRSLLAQEQETAGARQEHRDALASLANTERELNNLQEYLTSLRTSVEQYQSELESERKRKHGDHERMLAMQQQFEAEPIAAEPSWRLGVEDAAEQRWPGADGPDPAAQPAAPGPEAEREESEQRSVGVSDIFSDNYGRS